MTDWVDAGVLAGMSATLCLWLFFGAIGKGSLSWRLRARFFMSTRYRADAILGLGLAGYMAHGAFHRGIATYNFALQKWNASTPTAVTTAINLALVLPCIAGILWWMCIELFGTERAFVWWLGMMVSGATLGVGIGWRY